MRISDWSSDVCSSDLWYPEAARAMMLMGADVLFYPTAIGSEPHDEGLDTARLWRRAMMGHAVSNVVPIVAANRVGIEGGQTLYGTSFITDERGDVPAELDREEDDVITAAIDRDRAIGRARCRGRGGKEEKI